MARPRVLPHHVALDKPTLFDDGHGGAETGWTPVTEVRADYRYLRGGEAVQAGRLQGTVTLVVSVNSSAVTRQARPSWRVRDLRTGELFNIRSIMPTDDRMTLELTCQSGVAV